MNVAKHIFTLVMGVSIGAMAQTETAPDSLAATAVPDSVPVQPVAENGRFRRCGFYGAECGSSS